MYKRIKIIFYIAVLSIAPFLCSCQDKDLLNQSAKEIPVQHNGRIKSFDAFARETLRLISGKETWDKKPAISVILSNLPHLDNFLNMPFIRVDNLELKRMLSLPAEEKYFSYKTLKPAFPHIIALIQSAKEKRNNDVRPTALEQAAELLYSRLITVDQLASGDSIKVIPNSESDAWESPYQTFGVFAQGFKVLAGFYADGHSADFTKMAGLWIKDVSGVSKVPFQNEIRMELLYYGIKPFFYSWIFYLAAFVLLTLFQEKVALRFLGMAAFLAGFVFHSTGLLLRVLILQRPPVSNMYESMIFMNWILVICALIFFFIKKRYFFLTVGGVASALVMLFADFLPVEKSLDVLAPVLKSNYWLTIHVLTIVSSYGILGMAMALGHRHLCIGALKKFRKNSEEISAHVIYRLLQVGLIALGIGTVLGGVWANESWGRFWGWDPKETWALITFLGYMVVLHFRHTGKLGNFGLAVSSVLGFLLVLMTWYGVNFVLGRGLHSYGFGAGGNVWILCYLIFEVCFFIFVFLRKFKRA